MNEYKIVSSTLVFTGHESLFISSLLLANAVPSFYNESFQLREMRGNKFEKTEQCQTKVTNQV